MTVIPRDLRRDRSDGLVGGVIAGWSVYLDIDRTVLRFAFGLVTLLTAILPGVLAYALMWALIPAKARPASASVASP